jgi:hypothetical protein
MIFNLFLAKMRVTGAGMVLRYPYGMGMGTKSVTHAGLRMGTSILSNRGYGDEDYSTLPIAIPTNTIF